MADDILVLIPDADPDPDDVAANARLSVERARAFRIEHADDYKAGAEALRRIKRRREFLSSIHRPAIRSAKKAHDDAIAAFRALDSLYEAAYDAVKGQCEDWMRRQLAEQKRLADAAKAALVLPPAAAQEALGKAFDEAVARGDNAKAAHLLTQTSMPPMAAIAAGVSLIPTPPPPATDLVPKMEGISSATTWTFDVVDESLVPREFLELDRKKILGVVRAMKADTRIAGIIPRPDLGLRVRG